ncbi:MAG: formylglycine-generating enzyme family protein [Verrucomicrobia bacterium]|nr:formylglycine-generating enzyme family protein [Verrucomicrobiota bacterium]
MNCRAKTKTKRIERVPASVLLVAMACLSLPACHRQNSAPPAQTSTPPPEPPRLELTALTNMVSIKAGSFVRIRHPVTLTRDFWIGKYEVTQAEYAALMGHNPSHFTGDSNCPVEKLTCFEAEAYCVALSARERQAGRLPAGYEYRLPSEAEWEYACRAGTTNRFSFGDDAQAADAFAWTSENSEAKTHPVGQKSPNPWGLHDMHGNVWEWCRDWFAPYPASPTVDPVGPANSKFKVFRGGGWNQEIDFARSGNRFMMSPSNGIHFVGFRLALGQSSPAPGPD